MQHRELADTSGTRYPLPATHTHGSRLTTHHPPPTTHTINHDPSSITLQSCQEERRDTHLNVEEFDDNFDPLENKVEK